MKKKELLIIFLSALLVTWGSSFVSHPSRGCGDYPDALCEGGWPLAFHRVGGITGINQWLWLNLTVDIFFWLLVLTGGWCVVRKSKTSKQ